MRNSLDDTIKITKTVSHSSISLDVIEILDGEYRGQFYFDENGDYYYTLDDCIADAILDCKYTAAGTYKSTALELRNEMLEKQYGA